MLARDNVTRALWLQTMALTEPILGKLQSRKMKAFHAATFQDFKNLIQLQNSYKTVSCFVQHGWFSGSGKKAPSVGLLDSEDVEVLVKLEGALVAKFRDDIQSIRDSKGHKLLSEESKNPVLQKEVDKVQKYIFMKYLDELKAVWLDEKFKSPVHLYGTNGRTPISVKQALTHPDQVDIESVFDAAHKSEFPQSLFTKMADDYDRQFELLDANIISKIINAEQKASVTPAFRSGSNSNLDEVWLSKVTILQVLVFPETEERYKKDMYHQKFRTTFVSEQSYALQNFVKS